MHAAALVLIHKPHVASYEENGGSKIVTLLESSESNAMIKFIMRLAIVVATFSVSMYPHDFVNFSIFCMHEAKIIFRLSCFAL